MQNDHIQFRFAENQTKPVLIITKEGEIKLGEGCTNVEAAQAIVDLANQIRREAAVGELQRYSPDPENTEYGWMQGMKEDTSMGEWVHIEDLRGVLDPSQPIRELSNEMDRFRKKWKTVSIAEFNHFTDRLLKLIDRG